MSEQSPPSASGSGRRRSSLTEMFIPRPTTGVVPASSYSPPSASVTAPLSNAQNHRRGMSITTLGLGGTSPNQNSPLNAFAKQRRASVASSSSISGSPEFKNSFDDSAVIEEDHQADTAANTPATPSFARRVSFGAQALRDVKSIGGSSGGRHPSLFKSVRTQAENETPRNHLSSISYKTTTGGGSRGLFLSPSPCHFISCLRNVAY